MLQLISKITPNKMSKVLKTTFNIYIDDKS